MRHVEGAMRAYYVYIMASRSHHTTRLVYFEQFGDVRDAIAREKQLKGWVRSRKMRLIEQKNPTWEDLADTWFAAQEADPSHLRCSG